MFASSPARFHGSLTFVELSLVAAVLGVAVAVAIPEYMHLRQSASDDSAKTRLTQATQTLARHHASAGKYAGATLPSGVRLRTAGRSSFCVETTAGGHAWHALAQAKPSSGACPLG